MDEFSAINPIVIAAIAGFVGMLIGMGLMMLVQRRQTGGKSVAQLNKEMDEYRDKVSDHFATTSELFRDMTEKYRDVYNHLAAGSQALCEDPMEHGRLEFTETKAVTEQADDLSAEIEEELIDPAASVESSSIDSGSIDSGSIDSGSIESGDEIKIDPSTMRVS